MSATPARLRFILQNCDRRCSLNPSNLSREVGPLITRWFEEGESIPSVVRKANELGAKVSQGAVGRHRKNHLHPVAYRDPNAPEEPPKAPVSELDLLNDMISAGAEQAKLGDFRITAEQLLRAIELKMKLTQGSVFDAMFDEMKKAQASGLDLDAPADPPAQMGADEAAQAAPDDGS